MLYVYSHVFFFFNYPATTEFYTYCHTLSLHDALPISGWWLLIGLVPFVGAIILIVFYCLEGTKGPNRFGAESRKPYSTPNRSEEHTSELQSLMRISYAVFCLKKKSNSSKVTKQINTQ